MRIQQDWKMIYESHKLWNETEPKNKECESKVDRENYAITINFELLLHL